MSDGTDGSHMAHDDQDSGENAFFLINVSPTRPTWMEMENWTTLSLHRWCSGTWRTSSTMRTLGGLAHCNQDFEDCSWRTKSPTIKWHWLWLWRDLMTRKVVFHVVCPSIVYTIGSKWKEDKSSARMPLTWFDNCPQIWDLAEDEVEIHRIWTIGWAKKKIFWNFFLELAGYV